MRLLLDTHIVLWWLQGSDDLPRRAGEVIADRTNEVFVSPISLWEIAIKSRLGRIRAEVDEVLEASVAGGLRPLPFSLDHAARVARLPEIHRDPFDRALVAQAQHEPLYLLTHDAALAAYGEHILLV